MKILNVDDTPTERYIIKRVLESAFPDCILVQVEDSDEACKLLKRETFDLIIQDIIRPGTMNGAAFLIWFRHRDPAGDVPVILTTLLQPGALETLFSFPNVWALEPGAPREDLVILINKIMGSESA